MALTANVQEMVRSDPLQVPENFIVVGSEAEDRPDIISTELCHLSSEIPVIDLSLLSRGHTEELTKLDQACQEWGFFQVANHGVKTELWQEMKDATAEFFELSLEEKNKIQKLPDGFEGYGRIYAAAEGQILDWSDSLFLYVSPQHTNLKFWPISPVGFKETIEAYTSEVRRVGEELLRSLSMVMGREKDTLIGLHQELLQALRLNYIPPCSMPEKVLGISSHSDTTTITLLVQQDDVTGLQIRKQGGWVSVKPIANAFVVNVGDAMEIWSNGKYKSVEHRAITNERKSRISYASFFYPHNDAEVEPFLDQMVESTRMYKKIKFGEYLKACYSKGKLDGKAHTEIAKIAS